MEPKQGLQYWQRIVILLFFGWVALWIYRAVLTPIYSEIQGTIGPHTSAEMGLIASMYFITYTGMQIPSGILVDKIGKKAVLIPGFIIFAIAAILVGTAQNINMIYVGSLLAGLGTGAYYGGAYALAGSTIPTKYLTVSNAIINSGTAMGMALGLIGSSLFVKSLNMPWNICLYILAGIIIITTIFFAFIIKPEPKKEKKQVVESIQVQPEVGKSKLYSPNMIGSYLLYFANCYAYYMLVTWLPHFLETERGFEGAAIGMSAALIAFAAIPGALYFSRQADKYANRRTFIICSLEFTAALTLLLMIFAPSTNLLLLCLIAYGLVGKVATDPILISYITACSPRKNLGTFLTVFNFFGMISSILAPIITGRISDTTGTKVGGFYVSIIILVICATVFAFVNMKKNKDTAAAG